MPPSDASAGDRRSEPAHPAATATPNAGGGHVAADHAPSDPRTYTPRHLAEKILKVRAAVEGERKHVTVLFADVAGYTSLAERIDPEEMHALMDRCFQLILEAVHRYEGTVNQFTGDGVMALFGAPIALEDSPRRACSAALAIQDALAALDREVHERYGREFRMRIGIHSGIVVVGTIGDDLRMDYTAVGDTTNLANRLQQAARPGAVVISEATRRLISGYFELRELGELTVKGRSAPVRAFELLTERRVAGRIEAVAALGLTPYIGRARDLAQMEASFDSAAAGHGQVVFVVGDAGIGKSRLLYEFERRIADRPHLRLVGHCAPWARTSAFHCVVDALRRGFGLDDRDDDAAAIAKLEGVERRLGGDLEWTLPYLRALLSLPPGDERVAAMSAVTRRSETFRALQARFIREASRQPFVFVVEDLHWVDPASEEFLAFLCDSVPTTKALIVLTYRPGYRHRLGDRSYHVRLALQPLSDAETAEMARRLLDDAQIPDALRDVIAAKAEGNPFFIEEVLKSLAEEGVLRRKNGTVELAREIATLSIPDSVQDVIMARIDRLADAPKQAIQMAAVIGREFALRLLERIVEVGSRVSELVGELRALELIYEKAVHPELAYMFKHALTHDVAYESVLIQRRKSLHALVGAAIEELYAERLGEHYETLAYHYALAENWPKALDYYERAATKSASAFANHAAAEHLKRALAIADRLGERVDPVRRSNLLQCLGRVSFCLNEFRAAGDAYAEAARIDPDPCARSRCASEAGWCYHWGHDYAAARAALKDAATIARTHALPVAETFAGLVEGFADSTFGDFTCMERWTTAAAAIEADPRYAGDPFAAAVAATGTFCDAELAEWRGDFHRALDGFDSLLAAGHLQDNPMLLTHAEWFSGKAAANLGRYDEALAHMQGALDRSIRIGDRAMQSRLLNTIGWCYAELGCSRIGMDYNLRATELGRELVELELVAGAPELYGNALVNVAGDHIERGDLDAADEAIARVESELSSSDDPWMRWRYSLHVMHARARWWMARHEPERALASIAEELDGSRRNRAAKIEARALELRGRALMTLERCDEALEAVSEGLAIARRIAHPTLAWRALAISAELRRRVREPAQAKREHAEATALVAQIAERLPAHDVRDELLALGKRVLARPSEVLR